MKGKGSKGGKKAARQYRGKKRMNRRRRYDAPEMASCSVSQMLATGQTVSNAPINSYNISLANFDRAVNISKGYQFYRIKRVTYIFTPLVDTFANGAGSVVPYLYWTIDRLRQFQASLYTGAQFRQLGCKPIRLDEKTIKVSYRPSVQNATLDSAPPVGQASTQFTQYKISPWLACRDQDTQTVWNPDSTDHQGIVWLVETVGGATVPYKVERKIEFQFKKQANTLVSIPGGPTPLEVEDILEPLPGSA